MPPPQAPLSSTQLVKISHKINSPAGRRGVVFPAKTGNPGVQQFQCWGNSLPCLWLGDNSRNPPGQSPSSRASLCSARACAPHPSTLPPDPAPDTPQSTRWEWGPQLTKPQWTTPQMPPSTNQPVGLAQALPHLRAPPS